MRICIICKEIIVFNGDTTSYDICPNCQKKDLTENQRNILDQRKKEAKKE